MPSCCTFCKSPGHNIRTCLDPQIEETWFWLLRFIIPYIGLPADAFDGSEVQTYLLENVPRPLIVAISVQTARTRRNAAIAVHIANICLKVRSEFEYLNSLNAEMRAIWLDNVLYAIPLGQPSAAPAVIEPDVFAFVKPFHPVISPMMLCLGDLSAMTECSICFEDKKQIEIDTTNCGHAFCHKCICKHIETKIEQTKCPLCRTEIKTIEVNDPENYAAIEHRYSEMGAMLKDIYVMEFDDSMFAWGPYENQVEVIAHEFRKVPGFMENLGHHTGNLFSQAKFIWEFLNERNNM